MAARRGAAGIWQAAKSSDDLDGHGVYLAARAQRFPSQSDEYMKRAAAMEVRDSVHSLALSDDPAR